MNNNWNQAGNWSSGIPTAAHDVVIPNISNQPTIPNSYSAVAKSVTINSGATLTLNNNANTILTVSDNFTNNGTLSAGANSTVAFTGATASTIGGTSTSTFGNLTINKSAAATMVENISKAFKITNVLTVTQGNLRLAATDADYTVGSNLIVSTNGTLTHNVDWDTAAKQLNVSGSITISGKYDYTGRAHVSMKTGGRTITTGTSALSILTLTHTSGTITASGTVTVNDNFWASFNVTGGTFSTGSYIVNANASLLNAGGTVTIPSNGTLNVKSGFRIGYSTGAGTVNLSGGTLNADEVFVGDATSSPSLQGILTHSSGTANIGNLTIDGAGSTAYTCSGSPTINISGNWVNNKTFTQSTSTVNFTGNTAQTIGGNGSVATNFYNLNINNNSGGVAVGITGTNDDVTVTNTLTMTNGILTTSATNLLNITRTATNAVAGGSATSFINGPLRWTLPASITSGTAAYIFPVGKSSIYLPFTLVPRTGTGAITAQVEAFNTNSGGTPDTTFGSLSTTEYWSLVTTGNFTNTSTIGLSRPTAISPLNLIAGSTASNGTYTTLAGTAGANGVTGSNAIGTNRFFTFGRTHRIDTGTITGSPFCAGANVSVPYTIIGTYVGGNIFTAQLSDASGSFAVPVDIGTVTSTVAGTITATIPAGTAGGTGYRIRVVSSNPNIIGNYNGSNITINPRLTASVSISANPGTTICAGTSVTFTATPTNGGTSPIYQWKVNGSNVGTNSATYTTTGLTNGNAVTVEMTSNATPCLTGSPATSNTLSMMVNPNLPASVSISANPGTTICAGTSVTFTATPTNGGTSPIYQWKVNGSNVGTNSATYTTTGLTNGNVVTVEMTSNATPCLTGSPATSNTLIMNIGVVSTYIGGIWDNGIPNNNGLSAEIYGNYSTADGSFSACSCTINTGASLTVVANTYVELQGSLHNNGNVMIQDGANLIQIDNTAVNTGNIEVQKVFTFSAGRQQYNYVSSPTENTNLKSVYTGTLDNLVTTLYYNETNDKFYTSSGAYIAGRALALKEKSSGTEGTSVNPAKFIGVPFNGPLNYTLARTDAAHGYNLVGNPYPSNLDLEELYEQNLSAIDATFHFWDNRGNTEYAQQGSTYGGANYAKYNAVSGAGVGAGTPTGALPTRIPTRYISPAQGFLVQAIASSQELKFSNTNMRVSNAATSFFGRGTETIEPEKDRYWLTLRAPSNIETMAAVVYFANGQKTVGIEDSRFSAASDEIYSVVEGSRISINGLPNFDIEDVVSLGYRAFKTGLHTISLYNRQGVFANGQNIYLKDKQTGILTNLSEGSYSFSSDAGEFTNRFDIVYKPSATLGITNSVKDGIVIYRDGNDFVVRSTGKLIEEIELYDGAGRLQLQMNRRTKELRIGAEQLVNAMYIVKARLENGEIHTKKIVR